MSDAISSNERSIPVRAGEAFVAKFKREPTEVSDCAWLNGYAAALESSSRETTAPPELLNCGPNTPWDRLCGEPSCEYCGARTMDRSYYNGARQAAAMAHQSLQAMDEWINGGCGGRGPAVKSNGDPFCSRIDKQEPPT